MTAAYLWSARDTASLLRVPSHADDKYSRGVVALHTGSVRYPGAAVLGVEGAWRAGAGLVRYVGDELPRTLVLMRRPETVVVEGRAGAWVVGSGTDAALRSPAEADDLRAMLTGATPVVVDAGAIDLAVGATAPLIVTPHSGEFDRLRAQCGLPAMPRDASRNERAARVVETAGALGSAVLLKGAETIIADPDGLLIVVESRTSWLATAGTGDVLAGMVGTLIAANPNEPLARSAAAAAWLHAEAAALAAGTREDAAGHPIVALDVAEAVPAVIERVLTQ